MTSPSTKITAEGLEPERREILFKAIKNVLATDIAEKTMSQLIDGIPEAEFAWMSRGNFWSIDHPLYQHDKLCEGVLEKTRALRASFNPSSLLFNPKVLRAFEDCVIGSEDFKLRLIELVAVAIHEVGVFLFNLQPKFHSEEYIDHVVNWQKPAGWSEGPWLRHWEEPMFPPRPTMFFHCHYLDVDLYPNGVADAAGYWAEDRIFGGVVLFGRGDSGIECDGVFFDSGEDGETMRIWRLLKSQVHALIELFSRDDDYDVPLTDHPLPVHSTQLNIYRFDVWDAIVYHHVFRDSWERRIPEQKPPEGCTRSMGDYPELSEDLFEPANRALEAVEAAEAQENVDFCKGEDKPADLGDGSVGPDDISPVPATSASSPTERAEKVHEQMQKDVEQEGEILGQARKNEEQAAQYERPAEKDEKQAEADRHRRVLEEKDIALRRAPTSTGLDSSWILAHGGIAGEPLGNRRLPYIGPPEGERRPEPEL